MRILLLTLALALGIAGDAIGIIPQRQGAGCLGMTIPTVRAVGTISSATTAATPGLPSGTVAGDLLLMVCENSGEGAQTATGWAQAIDQAQTGTRLTVLWRVAASGSDATTTNDVGDHQACRIIGITLNTFCPSAPLGPTSTNQNASGTTVSITGVTTTLANSLIVVAQGANLPDPSSQGTAEFSCTAPCGTNTASYTERIDNTRNAGNGGSLYAATGTLAVAGASGTATVTAATTAVRAVGTIAINGR